MYPKYHSKNDDGSYSKQSGTQTTEFHTFKIMLPPKSSTKKLLRLKDMAICIYTYGGVFQHSFWGVLWSQLINAMDIPIALYVICSTQNI